MPFKVVICSTQFFLTIKIVLIALFIYYVSGIYKYSCICIWVHLNNIKYSMFYFKPALCNIYKWYIKEQTSSFC